MDENFELPVQFNGKELMFPARLIQFGYSYRIEMDINETLVSFEKDEERNWRAILSDADINQNKSIQKELITAIVVSLESNL